MERAPILKISVHALGGQGGGVLTDWIIQLARHAGYIGQSTSVPGVAQRTGATVYYIELYIDPSRGTNLGAELGAETDAKKPVLALMPIPNDVDIVIASEIMEVGRAMSRGLVSSQTTVIGSSHRVYAISEKSNAADGRLPEQDVIDMVHDKAHHFVCGDMQAAAYETGSVISAVLFGALAGSGALPMETRIFEDVIRAGGRAVETNLAGFKAGLLMAQNQQDKQTSSSSNETKAAKAHPSPPPAPQVMKLLAQLESDIPPLVQHVTKLGLAKVLDYQDDKYAARYLQRVSRLAAHDEQHGGLKHDWEMTRQGAKYLALWMCGEDIFRIADLKIRETRFNRFKKDIKASDNQIMHISEYLYPRIEELCDILPAGLARRILSSTVARKMLSPFLGKGRRIKTTGLAGFLILYLVAQFRFMRPFSLKYIIENKRIDDWLKVVHDMAAENYSAAIELARLPHLLKGYGETYEKGMRNFNLILQTGKQIKIDRSLAKKISGLHEAALDDDDGAALQSLIGELGSAKSGQVA